MRRRLVVLVALLVALSAISLVLAVRASAPVRPDPVAVVVRQAPSPKTRFPIRHVLEPWVLPSGVMAKTHAYPTVLTLEELLAGLSLPSSSARLVEELVRTAQAETRVLRNTPDATGQTWDAIIAASDDYAVVAERLYHFRKQVVPGAIVTFDDRQVSILDALRGRIEAELQQHGMEPLSKDPPLLLPLLHQSLDFWNWHWLYDR